MNDTERAGVCQRRCSIIFMSGTSFRTELFSSLTGRAVAQVNSGAFSSLPLLVFLFLSSFSPFFFKIGLFSLCYEIKMATWMWWVRISSSRPFSVGVGRGLI